MTDASGDSISFPAGSLVGDTNITLRSVPLPQVPPAGVAVVSRAFVAKPDGLTFNPMALPTVTIQLLPGDVNGLLDVSSVQVMVWDSVALQWMFVGGTVTPNGMGWALTFQPLHFSDYGFFDCKTGLVDYEGDGIGNVCDPDDDNDVCADDKEALLTPALNPLNEWDFYTVPVPALLLGQKTTRDSGIGVTTDVVALLKYAGKVSTDLAYTQDMDLNGVQDGLQYDRKPKIVGPNIFPDPPDGGIGVTTDVVTMLKWAGKTC